MATAQSLHQPTVLGHAARTIGHGIASVVRGIARFFSLLQHANLAALEYDRLSNMSDEKLAARGLSRDDIGKVVVGRL